MRPNIIITHGLGNHPENFHEKLKNRILEKLDANIVPFYYHDIIQPYQERHFKKYADLGNQGLRKFVFENVADGVTYHEPAIYKQVHEKLFNLIESLRGKPLVIIASSLGCKVILDHIWDHEKKVRPDHYSDLKLFITNGCNIPLFVSGLPRIEHLKNQSFTWVNFYHDKDILGYPLAPLGYPVHDVRVRSGWGLASHLKYWSNKKYIDTITNLIINL